MEMGMKYLLEGGFPVCQEKVHSLAAKAASPKRLGESVTYAEHMRPRFLVQFLKIGGVVFGNDQQVTGIYRSGVHKSEDEFVFEDDVGGHAAANYLAEEAVILVRGHRGILPVMPYCPRSAAGLVTAFRNQHPIQTPQATSSSARPSSKGATGGGPCCPGPRNATDPESVPGENREAAAPTQGQTLQVAAGPFGKYRARLTRQ